MWSIHPVYVPIVLETVFFLVRAPDRRPAVISYIYKTRVYRVSRERYAPVCDLPITGAT